MLLNKIRENKASILIYLLMIFTVIYSIFMMSIKIIISNNEFMDENHKYIQMKEDTYSSIEICNYYLEDYIRKIASSTNDSKEFHEFMKLNIYDIFEYVESKINEHIDITKVSINDVDISEKECVINISSKVINSDYNKSINVNIKIVNPWNKDELDLDNIIKIYDYKEI